MRRHPNVHERGRPQPHLAHLGDEASHRIVALFRVRPEHLAIADAAHAALEHRVEAGARVAGVREGGDSGEEALVHAEARGVERVIEAHHGAPRGGETEDPGAEGQAIETQWHSSDSRSLDAVFIEDNGEWHLDWDHFARHSDYPWSLFLAGSGENHGEFRLLARERLAKERKNAESISIVFYAPRFGYSNEAGSQSPEFLIPRNTPNGRLLDAAFKLEREGKRPFGVKLHSINPEGLIRVRVKVRRVEDDEGRHFELDEVAACHWYANDAKGVEITEKPAK